MCFQRQARVLELMAGIAVQAGIDDGFILSVPAFQQHAGCAQAMKIACGGDEVGPLVQWAAQQDFSFRQVRGERLG